MKVEVREDSVFISGYVNAIERISKPIRESLHGKIKTFVERIKAGVFRSALKRNDNVLVLLNHNYERVLASTKDGNAILEEDNIGLRAEITITDKEVVEKARSGKLSGWSFGFVANDDEETNEDNNPYPIRTVTDMELIEVSILDETKAPAYYGTSIEMREGGAKVVEIRADEFTNEEQTEEQTEGKQTISIEELATLVASKVIEALKTEEKAEEETEETQTEEEQTEEPQSEEPSAEPSEEQTEETQSAEETEEQTEEENRSIDYSSWEERLAKIKR